MKGAAGPGAPATGRSAWPTGDTMPSPVGTGAGESENSPRGAVQVYFAALRSGNAEQAAAAFTPDGLAAVQGSPTAEGTQALRKLYQETLAGEQAGKYQIHETRKLGDDRAFVLATSEQDGQSYREFFLLDKSGGGWKITRYMSNQEV